MEQIFVVLDALGVEGAAETFAIVVADDYVVIVVVVVVVAALDLGFDSSCR